MAETFLLEIVTPYRRIVKEEVEELTAPGSEGEFGVLPGHAPLLATLKTGELSYKKEDTTSILAVSGGYAEVAHDTVTILAEFAERAEEIDLESAEKETADMEERLKGLGENDEGYLEVERSLERAQTRVSVARKNAEK